MMKKRGLITLCAALCAVSLSTADLSAASKRSSEPRYDMLLNMVHHNPGEPLFTTRYTQPPFVKSLGYNIQVIKREVQCGVTYDRHPEYAVPYGSEEREWIERHAAAVRIQMKQIKDEGLQNIPFTDMLVVPQSLMKRYEKEMVDEYGKISIFKPRTEAVLRAQIDELFWRFPELDGLMIRHGETYLHDTPLHVGSSPARSPEEHCKFINILREELCVKRGKVLIYRTWDFSNLHTLPKVYDAAMSGVEPHEKLYISIKHTTRDFFRNQPFNPNIGRGNLQQIVEVSTNQAGLYGKNSHPYYIGRGVIDGWCEMAADQKKGLRDLYDNKQIRGFWTWTWGDGWGGPYFDNEFWIKLNEFVIRRFTQQPERTEESIFNEYATDVLKLSKADVKRFRELNLLSEEAAFYGQSTQLFPHTVWFSRDQYFACLDLDNAVKKNVIEAALKEKHDNLKRWYRIEELARQIKLQSPEDQEFMEVSTTYGRIKYELYEQMWIMEMMVAQNKVNGTKINREQLLKAISAYDKKFAEWQKLKADYACCPTLYIDYRLTPFAKIGVPFKTNLDKLRKYATSGIGF
ncbi:MAG: hypothetical protein SNG14_00935 [Rikenellaceae bacterium]